MMKAQTYLPKKLERVLSSVKPISKQWVNRAKYHHRQLLMPAGALDGILWVVEQLAGIRQEFPVPHFSKPRMVLFAADHGVAECGVSTYPQEVTAQMLSSFANKWAVSTVLAQYNSMDFRCIDVGVKGSAIKNTNIVNKKIAQGTHNFLNDKAMSFNQAAKALAVGISEANQLKQENNDIAIVGEMGIGNTTAASAITAAILGLEPDQVTGAGTGLKENQVRKKAILIKQALVRHHPDPKDSMSVLISVGGLEIGAMTGFLLGCAANRIPVILDGFITGAAALLAYQLKPQALEYWIAGTSSREPGHRYILQYLKLKPLLDLGLRLGEGSAAALSYPLLNEAVIISSKTATFAQAKVHNKNA